MNRNAGITAAIKGDNTSFKNALKDSDAAAKKWAAGVSKLRPNVAGGGKNLVESFTGGFAGGGGSALLGTLGRFVPVGAAVGGALAGVGAAAYGAKKAFDAAADMEDVIWSLKQASDGSMGLNEQLEYLKNTSASMGGKTGFKDLIQGVVMFESAGMGFQKSVDLFTELANVSALTGGTAEDIKNMSDALKDMLGGGQVTDEKMDRITEAAPKMAAVLQQSFGAVTAEGLRAKGIKPTDLVDGLLTGLKKLERAPITSNVKIAKLKDELVSAEVALGSVVKMGVDPLLNGVRDTVSFVKSHTTGGVPLVQETPEELAKAKARFAEVEEQKKKAAAEAEAKRQKHIADTMKIDKLEAKIAEVERGGDTFADDLRLELALLKEMEGLKKSLNATDAEARKIIEDRVAQEADAFQRDRRERLQKEADAKRQQLLDQAAGQVENQKGEKRGRVYNAEESKQRSFERNKSMMARYGTYAAYKYETEDPTRLKSGGAATRRLGLEGPMKAPDTPGLDAMKKWEKGKGRADDQAAANARKKAVPPPGADRTAPNGANPASDSQAVKDMVAEQRQTNDYLKELVKESLGTGAKRRSTPLRRN